MSNTEKLARSAVIAWALIATVGIFALALQQGRSNTALDNSSKAVRRADSAVARANAALAAVVVQQTRIHSQLAEGCKRGNLQRLTNNRANYASYVVFSFIQQRFLKPTKNTTKKQVAITKRFAKRLKRAVASEEWTPLTNCAQAIGLHGPRYRSPEPVPFSKRLPPASQVAKP